MPEAEAAEVKGTCFVVMGFGKKTDFETGRTLDLEKSYKNIIKPAVTAAGLRCVRADEISHSGVIDVPMYEQLLKADVVVADLSTSNKNAFYELGVRHALRPYTTIVICEDGAKSFPFDVNHVLIRQYHHMGEGIDFDEVERFRRLLTDAIVEIYNQDPRPRDSPVYTFLNDLTPPALEKALKGVAVAVAETAPVVEEATRAGGVVYSELMEQVDEAQKEGDFVTARALLSRLRRKLREAAPERPEDPYLVQRLALVTYKSKQPNPQAALEEARDLLATLNPATTNDTETLGLWGAVHKRLWDETKDAKQLDEAVRGYERGFYLRNDYYNGINLAFLLNVRAAHAPSPAEAVADFVQAERVRREVLSICDDLLRNETLRDSDKYWVLATRAEALLGIGETAQADQAYTQAYASAPEPWMTDSTKEQRTKLQTLLADSPLKHLKPDAA
ncbi:MAG TPA: TRAFs-binding domain-containing protein [Pyrinomonadaceae bacterium]|nr:TRAFs-binding domain-containing protein [Pyrinomonadaceae bacterium]